MGVPSGFLLHADALWDKRRYGLYRALAVCSLPGDHGSQYAWRISLDTHCDSPDVLCAVLF